MSYLCSRVHAVRTLWGREGVGHNIVEQRLTTLCFWTLEPRKFKLFWQEHRRVDATGGIHLPLVCRGVSASQAHFNGCTIYHGVGVIFCLFSEKVFLGPKRRTGRMRVHALFVSCWFIFSANSETLLGSAEYEWQSQFENSFESRVSGMGTLSFSHYSRCASPLTSAGFPCIALMAVNWKWRKNSTNCISTISFRWNTVS